MMNISRRITPILVTGMVLAMTSLASAHPGHGVQGLASGMEHPVTGLDHMLAMVGVGLLAAGIGRRALWTLPATFVPSMLFGAALGAAGLFVPSWLAEYGISGSVVVFGLLITLGAKFPVPLIAALTGLFAICHGSAHAAEMPAGSSMALFFIGFTISTAVLHAVGIGMGLAARQKGPSMIVRAAGAVISAFGLSMLVGIL